MLFNSVSFLLFFVVTTACFYATPRARRWAPMVVASALFYMAFVPAYILVLGLTIFIDYAAALLIERARHTFRRALLAVSIVANVGVLAAFKYFAFLNENLAVLANSVHLSYPGAAVMAAYSAWLQQLADLFRGGYPLRGVGLLLPLGLSFHTFQAMAYTIEVYRGRQRAIRHLGLYALYVLFYPQLVAGPIERPRHLLPQLRRPARWDYDRVATGLRRMLWGFFKKLVIADRAAVLVDAAFDHPSTRSPAQLALASYLFALQIYCDFSAYTDIALGAAAVVGVRLTENFNRPYLAVSVADFWRRWHISLSSWFRDYVYVPLGGNRAGKIRWTAHVFVVFVISGLWHGAGWTFAVWGMIHALYLVAERAGAALLRSVGPRRGPPNLAPSRVGRAVRIVLTFHLVTLAWIVFRARTVSEALFIVRRIVDGLVGRLPWALPHEPVLTVFDVKLLLSLGLALAVLQALRATPRYADWMRDRPFWQRWPADYILVLLIVTFGHVGGKSFVYFQF